jgi:hypothetical protein
MPSPQLTQQADKQSLTAKHVRCAPTEPVRNRSAHRRSRAPGPAIHGQAPSTNLSAASRMRPAQKPSSRIARSPSRPRGAASWPAHRGTRATRKPAPRRPHLDVRKQLPCCAESNPSTVVRAPDGHPTLSTANGDPLPEAIVRVNCLSAPGRSHCSSATGRSSPTVARKNADARDSATSIRRTASGDNRSQAFSKSMRAATTYCKASSCSRSDNCRRSRHTTSSSWRRSRSRSASARLMVRTRERETIASPTHPAPTVRVATARTPTVVRRCPRPRLADGRVPGALPFVVTRLVEHRPVGAAVGRVDGLDRVVTTTGIARRSALRLGDRLRFDGGQHAVIGLSGASVRLAGDDVHQGMLATHLQGTPDSRCFPVSLPPLGLLDAAPLKVVGEARASERP